MRFVGPAIRFEVFFLDNNEQRVRKYTYATERIGHSKVNLSLELGSQKKDMCLGHRESRPPVQRCAWVTEKVALQKVDLFWSFLPNNFQKLIKLSPPSTVQLLQFNRKLAPVLMLVSQRVDI